MKKLNYFELFIKGTILALICLIVKTGLGMLPAHSAELTPRQAEQKQKTEYYLKDHFYKALKPGHGVDVARKYAFYSVEEFNNLLDNGYSLRQARGKAIVNTYKVVNGDTSDYSERLMEYKQGHKAKYYAKRAMFWPMSIPSTMVPPKAENSFVQESNGEPAPVITIPTGSNNIELLHPANDPFTRATPVFKMSK